jgi:hypothetical protein
LLKAGAPAPGPAELPQLTGRPVIVVQGGVHLFGVTIDAVTIQRDADVLDEFVQARLVVRSDMFLRVAVGAAHGVDAHANTDMPCPRSAERGHLPR